MLNLLGFLAGAGSTKAVDIILKKKFPQLSDKQRALISAGSVSTTSLGGYSLTTMNAFLFGIAGSVVMGGVSLGMSKPKEVLKLAESHEGKTLKELLNTLGLDPQSFDKAQQVKGVVYKLDPKSSTQTVHYWDSEESDSRNDDWYPASTVKYLAAIGAAKRLSENGFSRNAVVEFKDVGKAPTKTTFKKLVEDALVKSDNTAYNRLVQLAGHGKLHNEVLNVYPTLRLNKPYMKDSWQALTGHRTFKSPPIELSEGGRSVEIPSAEALPVKRFGSEERSSYSSVPELAQSLLRLVVGLPSEYGLSKDLHQFLLDTLSTRKLRGNDFVDRITNGASGRNFKVFHKPGFAINYMSDAVVLVDTDTNEIYAISFGTFSGRDSILSYGEALGKLLSEHTI